jgi:murein DD-endopeptidase MepM/ murein hydrolase activator NlpD/predicted nucleotidyltransferase
MKKDTEILSSFDLKKGLNPKVWVKDNKSTKLKPEIREKLLEIAYEFIEFLGVDIIVSDVHMTGSMANYNWSKYSDFDLHVIVDFDQFPKDQLELYKELFKLKKTLFNSDHNIKIYGYDVELYLQDSNEPHFSTGVYSVIYNKWLTPPKKGDFKADKEVLMSKVNQWTEKIDEVIDSAKGKDLEAALKLLDGFKDKLKKYRQSGLEGGGELSYENLVFKYLRRNGYIEKLFNFENEKVDKELSLEQKLIGEQGIKDFFTNLFSGKKSKKSDVKIDDPKKADLVDDDVAEFYKTLESIKEPLSQQKRGQMNFQKDVETVQIALQLLGYELPRYGVDGLFGPETANAVNKFLSDNDTTIKESFKLTESVLSSPVPIEKITSPFGEKRSYESHPGVDLRAASGTEVKSPSDGEVINAEFSSKGCGGLVTIKHGGGFQSRYCHLKDIKVSQGQKLKQGEVIGLSGGNSSDKGAGNSKNAHLHFELKLNGTLVDPMRYVGKEGNYNLTTTKNGVVEVTPEMVKVMIEKLKSKGIKSEDLKKYIDVVNTGGGEGFTDIDLMSEEGYKKYENICQRFISARGSNLLGITGEMMAKAAKSTYTTYQKYVPPQLALAQMTIEGGFSSNPNSRPIRTKNPYNVGNVDNGNNKYFSDVQSAIQTYYDLIARNYLTGGKTAKDLANNFVNKNNNRYASSSDYENKLSTLVNQINNTA